MGVSRTSPRRLEHWLSNYSVENPLVRRKHDRISLAPFLRYLGRTGRVDYRTLRQRGDRVFFCGRFVGKVESDYKLTGYRTVDRWGVEDSGFEWISLLCNLKPSLFPVPPTLEILQSVMTGALRGGWKYVYEQSRSHIQNVQTLYWNGTGKTHVSRFDV